MSTKYIIQTVDAEKARIMDELHPPNKAIVQMWKNSLNRIRVQLVMNTDSLSIVNQLEKELTNYATCINEFAEQGIPGNHPAMILVENWGQSLRTVYDKLRTEHRFTKALDRMVEKLV